jgi:hypothetical protein
MIRAGIQISRAQSWQLINSLGQPVQSGQLQPARAGAAQEIRLRKDLANGLYRLRLEDSDAVPVLLHR